MPTMIIASEIHRETDPISNEVTTRTSDKVETSKFHEKQTLIQVATSVDDVVLVEDASNDEEVGPDAQVTVENPSYLSPSKMPLPYL